MTTSHRLNIQKLHLEGRVVPACPYGPVFAANTLFAAGHPTIAMDNDGDYVIAWSKYLGSSEVYARRFDADNTPLGPEFLVNSETSGIQEYPDIAMNATGDVVIVWQSGDSSGYVVKGQRYSAGGIPQGGEFSVHSSSHFGSHPKVAIDLTGDFVITWNGGPSGFAFARQFESDGTPKGPEFAVTTNNLNNGADPSISIDADGDFVIVYRRGDGLPPNQTGTIWARVFDESGIPQGNEFTVNNVTNGNNTFFPDVAMSADGDFVVTWSLVGPAIQARQYQANGTPIGPEFMVNDLPLAASRSDPKVTMDDDGNFVIVWSQGQTPSAPGGIIGQVFDSSSVRKGSQFTAYENSGVVPDVSIGRNQDFVVAWGGFPPGPTFSIGIGVQQYVGPPRVEEVTINDGSIQRSLIKSITIHFCEQVSFIGGISNAFQLVRTGPGANTGPVQVVAIQTGNDVRLVFSSSGPVGLDPGASLIDGYYQLSIIANSVMGSSGLVLDGNSDREPGGNYQLVFHRLFGDVNGDRTVNAVDFAVFRSLFGTASSSPFDFDGDSQTNATDFAQFRGRFGITLTP